MISRIHKIYLIFFLTSIQYVFYYNGIHTWIDSKENNEKNYFSWYKLIQVSVYFIFLYVIATVQPQKPRDLYYNKVVLLLVKQNITCLLWVWVNLFMFWLLKIFFSFVCANVLLFFFLYSARIFKMFVSVGHCMLDLIY